MDFAAKYHRLLFILVLALAAFLISPAFASYQGFKNKDTQAVLGYCKIVGEKIVPADEEGAVRQCAFVEEKGNDTQIWIAVGTPDGGAIQFIVEINIGTLVQKVIWRKGEREV